MGSECSPTVQPEKNIFWTAEDEIIESLKSERDLYFSKLVELEVLLKDAKISPILKESFTTILKAEK